MLERDGGLTSEKVGIMHLLSLLAVPTPWFVEVRWNVTSGGTVV